MRVTVNWPYLLDHLYYPGWQGSERVHNRDGWCLHRSDLNCAHENLGVHHYSLRHYKVVTDVTLYNRVVVYHSGVSGYLDCLLHLLQWESIWTSPVDCRIDALNTHVGIAAITAVCGWLVHVGSVVDSRGVRGHIIPCINHRSRWIDLIGIGIRELVPHNDLQYMNKLFLDMRIVH